MSIPSADLIIKFRSDCTLAIKAAEEGNENIAAMYLHAALISLEEAVVEPKKLKEFTKVFDLHNHYKTTIMTCKRMFETFVSNNKQTLTKSKKYLSIEK